MTQQQKNGGVYLFYFFIYIFGWLVGWLIGWLLFFHQIYLADPTLKDRPSEWIGCRVGMPVPTTNLYPPGIPQLKAG